MEHAFHVLFDDFKFKSDQGLFHESGFKINLKPKELSVLEALLRQHGKLVTKEQLIEIVWKGTNTSDESISRSISVIKSCLRDASPGAELLIKTEYGRGYRFSGVVSFCNESNLKDTSKQKKISDVASSDILYCDTNTTVLEAAHLLHRHLKSSIIINQNGLYIGIWTEADALNLDLSDPSVFETNICEVMHSPVTTIQEWKPLSDAVLSMRGKGIRHLLVVDRYAKATGVISQTDLVRSHGVESFLTVKDVKSVVYKSPLVITENLQVSEVVHLMRLKHTEISIISLPGREMFSFTERDLMGLIASKHLSIFVSELENKALIAVNEDTTLLAARQLMEIKQIRHLVVLDLNGDLLKVLGLADILQVIEHSYVHLLEEILEQNKRIISAKEDHIHMLTNAVQQTAGMILISDKFGNIEYVNKSFEDISGYTLEEVKGLNPRFLKSGSTQPTIYQNLWQTLFSGQTWKGELCNQSKSGDIYWVLASITPIYDEQGELIHFVAVEEDITERIAMETKFKQSEKRFHDMANASPIMFWESGIDGKIFYFSEFCFKFTGLELTELYGNGWARQIHPDDLKEYLRVFQQAMIERKTFTIDHRIKNAVGEYRWVMNHAMPNLSKGNFIGFRGFCIDITERKTRELTAQMVSI
jgi:PAS domain S-box-containing protein